ncbi:SIMPL domain-containing protein [Sphingomonas sp.]|uniref:SIMPL domain-containing protein n=1 Tax=Sphingomonas sp. TaxID=28214 RepID=UPI003B3A590B
MAVAAGAANAHAESITPQIQVAATGVSKTAPDTALIALTVRGEGATSDDAVRQLSQGSKAIRGALASVLGADMEFETAALSIAEVRPKACDDSRFGTRRLSTGECAIIGYIAQLPVTVRSNRIKDVGTAIGLASRLGASEVQLAGYALADPAAARRRAMQAAVAAARDQAQAIADSSGAKLGPLLRVVDNTFGGQAVIQRAPNMTPAPPPAPPPPPPPIPVDLSPQPISTTVQISVSYSIVR